ncbi:MAG: class II aldolase/adducin family protein [Beijerinckiaceae bacterium]|nr:class II aldolase/adducin family protein [Beijerinckiaceae bacterium]
MNVQSRPLHSGNPLSVSDSEWQVRLELAAAHRIMAHFGFTDLAHNHCCVRVPDEPDAFLIKAADSFFEEVTASNLVKYDFDGNPRQEGAAKLRGGGLIIHAGLMAARPDINATLHSHTAAIMGVASQRHGLLPINQHAMHFIGKVAYHDFGGFEFDIRQRAPLIQDLGDKNIALLRNHGSLICGKSIGAIVVSHHQLETACQGQIAALAGGAADFILIGDESQAYALGQMKTTQSGRDDGGKDWKGLLRMADRLYPDYKN